MNPVGTESPAQPRRTLLLLITVGAAVVIAVALSGAGLYAVGRAMGLVRDGVSVDRCHSDDHTVEALRREAILTTAPPGATLGELREVLPCGRPPRRGVLDRQVTGAGPVSEVSAYYASLAARGGWQTDQGAGIYSASKPGARGCRWELVIRSVATGTYHVQISYAPRDRAAACV